MANHLEILWSILPVPGVEAFTARPFFGLVGPFLLALGKTFACFLSHRWAKQPHSVDDAVRLVTDHQEGVLPDL